ncbi:hypothetical protein WJR50_32930 [Catalinimonas sp. 4WD22]|uniref:hypothetical protein n=1 Tax=Catalinimonas locisalis TaxID=3133978 RepID=UPI003101B2BC
MKSTFSGVAIPGNRQTNHQTGANRIINSLLDQICEYQDKKKVLEFLLQNDSALICHPDYRRIYGPLDTRREYVQTELNRINRSITFLESRIELLEAKSEGGLTI